MRRATGFALVEALVAMALSAVLLASLAGLLVSQARSARWEIQRMELQQAARSVRRELVWALRSAGRGGAALGPLPAGLALELVNGAPAGSRVGALPVEPQTDVLIVRGVFEGSVFRVRTEVEPPDGGLLHLEGELPREARRDLLELVPGEALVLSDLGGRCAIVELATVEQDAAERLRVRFRSSGTARAEVYSRLSDRCPELPDLTLALRAGVLEELQYYVRRSDRGGGSYEPRLSRARLYPGTNERRGGGGRASGDLVDGVVDLQVALGFDLDGDGEAVEGSWGRRATDEWWPNHPEDADETASEGAALRCVRFSILIRARRPTTGLVSMPIDRHLDRRYDEPRLPGPAARESRSYLRIFSDRLVRWSGP